MKAKVCLTLSKKSAGLGPWWTKPIVKMRIDRDAKICVNLRGNQKGLSFNEYYNPLVTITGISFRTHNEKASPKKVNVFGGVPSLKTDYARYVLFALRISEQTLLMNPLRQYRDKIPRYYRPSDGRRLSSAERFFSQRFRSTIKPIPLLNSIVSAGRFPDVIPYKDVMEFIEVWSHTWSEKDAPEGYREEIKRDALATLAQSSRGIEATVHLSPDTIKFPGFYARFKNIDPPELQYVLSKGWPYRPDKAYMARATFTSRGVGEMPYEIRMASTLELERLLVNGMLDLGSLTADATTSITLDKDGSEAVIHLAAIRARLNPFRYGISIETTGGIVYSGRPLDDIPSGIRFSKDKAGNIQATINLATRQEIATPRGSFTVKGDLIGMLGARWMSGQEPRLKAGENRVEIGNFALYRKGSAQPLVSRARLVITDRLDDRKILAVAHPRFRTGNSGFIVRLELEDLNGLGYEKGYVVGFIPVPRDATDRFYDPARFSVQRTLNIAFGLVTKDLETKIKGNIHISELDRLTIGRQVIDGSGIEISGQVMSLSKGRVRRLVDEGSLKILSRRIRTKDGNTVQQWFAVIKASALGTAKKSLYGPSLAARFSLHNSGSVLGIALNRVIARFRRARWNSLRMGTAGFSGRLALSYNYRNTTMHIRNLGVRFWFNRIAPRRLDAMSRGRYKSFDMDGYLSGYWRHDLRKNRGRGFLMLRGDKEGDIHLRNRRGIRVGSRKLKRETPLFSDTRWVALRITGVDRRGALRGKFCLRTDVDLMALRPAGITQTDYLEWTMAHDSVGLLNGMLTRSKKYYRKLTRGRSLPRGSKRNHNYCKKVLSTVK